MSGSVTQPITSLFTRATDLPPLKRDRLVLVLQDYAPDLLITDDFIWEQLMAAEATLQHELRCYFTPRLVMPDLSTPADIAAQQALNPTLAIITEPGYDFDDRLFQGESWGLIQLRQLPIIAVNSITFNYPLPTQVAYTIPTEWIRPDLARGIINLVPVQTNSALPLNIYFLSVLGGGTMTSFIMQISYVCGMVNAKRDYPDLVNLIRRKAVLNVLDNLFIPQSYSTSVDGLSQSISMDILKYQESIEKTQDRLMERIHGLRMTVC